MMVFFVIKCRTWLKTNVCKGKSKTHPNTKAHTHTKHKNRHSHKTQKQTLTQNTKTDTHTKHKNRHSHTHLVVDTCLLCDDVIYCTAQKIVAALLVTNIMT